MLKFNEQEEIKSVEGALALRSQINQVVDGICDKGYKNICWLGIGGTYASAMLTVIHMKEKSAIDTFSENAAEFMTTGNRRLGEGSVVIFSSVTGNTKEVVEAVALAKEKGATIIGFLDQAGTDLGSKADYEIVYPKNENLKFFMVADRFMARNNEFSDYEAFYRQLDQHLAQGLVNVAKQCDEFAKDFAYKHMNDCLHYFVGAGILWPATYSYAMCCWEEQHWLKTKSVHAAEFFHGTLEVIERDVPITIFIGEDSQRALGKRVADFVPKICSNYTIIDAADYPLEGIDDQYRGNLSSIITHVIDARIDVYLEHFNCHPMEIRRYYRKLNY